MWCSTSASMCDKRVRRCSSGTISPLMQVEEVPLEERHPLIEHWKRRMDEDPVYVREDVSRKLAASAVWPTAAERSSETSFRRKKRAIRTHNAKTTYSPIGGFAAWASGSEP